MIRPEAPASRSASTVLDVTVQTGWQLTEELVLAIALSQDSLARYFTSSG